MKKHIFLVNFPNGNEDNFGTSLERTLSSEGVSVKRVYAVDFALDLGNGAKHTAKLVSTTGEATSVEGNIFFMKRRRPDASLTTLQYASLFLDFVNYLGGDCLNSRFLQHDKATEKPSQYINLIRHNFRIPRTVIIHGSRIKEFRSYIESTFSYPFVIKAAGSCGRSVWKISRFTEIEEHLSAIEDTKNKESIIIQEYVETSSEEFRALVFLGEVVAVIKRSSDSFYNNHAQGGIVSAGLMSESERKLALEAAKISGLDYVGVDFMRDANGEPVFMELQTGPSLTVTKIVNPEVVTSIAKLLSQRAKE
jgi:RimK family alpha-L-glutamate ligase